MIDSRFAAALDAWITREPPDYEAPCRRLLDACEGDLDERGLCAHCAAREADDAGIELAVEVL